MSDSLRDQLLKAGFKQKAPSNKNKKTNSKKKAGKAAQQQRSGHSSTSRSTQGNNPARRNHRPASASKQVQQNELTAEEILQKKALKEKIKVLIESNCVKDYAGTASYGFLVSNRVRQLFVKEEYRKLLSEGSLVITRLNGNTHLVPPKIAEEILAINPQWAVFSNTDDNTASVDSKDEYAEYQVPDDLIW